jgi:hypothetical protein
MQYLCGIHVNTGRRIGYCDSLVTFINVFTVDPAQQEKLFPLLKDGTETLFSQEPSFFAARFHNNLGDFVSLTTGNGKSVKDLAASAQNRDSALVKASVSSRRRPR